jgi:small-conductance mechanosensitive channel
MQYANLVGMKRGLDEFRYMLEHNPMELVLPLVIFAATFLVVWVVRRLVLRALHAWNGRAQNRAGLILYESLSGPMLIWALMLGVHFAMQSSDLPPRVTALGAKVLLVLWILSLTIMFMRVAGDMVRLYGAEIPGALPVTTLTQNVAKGTVLIIGALILLGQFGISIAPVLTALGVGGLAVALALQDTLSNLFGGFWLAVAGQVRLGDYIKLNTGEEGYVTDIGWRSTTIRALANNMIIVPNSKLAQAIVTNYHMPEKRMGASFQVTVGYDCDIDQVERVIGELLSQAVKNVPGMLAEPAPGVAFDPGFGENGIGLTVNYQVAEFANQFGVRNELRRRIYFRFRQEGIAIPYPSRMVYLRGAGRRAHTENNLQREEQRPHQ